MPKKSAEWRCNSPQIQSLILARNWKQLDDFHKIKEIYDFVRNEIKFGYNANDSVTATQVLKDGYGQCNTKGTLFMALLRGVGIPCRVHGFTINKLLQKYLLSVSTSATARIHSMTAATGMVNTFS